MALWQDAALWASGADIPPLLHARRRVNEREIETEGAQVRGSSYLLRHDRCVLYA